MQTDETDVIFLAFLVKAERNRALVAIHTMFGGKLHDGREIRTASAMSQTRVNKALEAMDKGVPLISTWKMAYEWFANAPNWGAFSQCNGLSMFPHWFGKPDGFTCRRGAPGQFAFVDCATIRDNETDCDADILGLSPDPIGGFFAVQFEGNMMLTSLPLFSHES